MRLLPARLSQHAPASLLLIASLTLASSSLAHAQSTAGQYVGVSHPPADDTIVANQDASEDAASSSAHKPLPGVPAVAAAAPGTTSTAAGMTVAPIDNPDYGIVGSTAGNEASAKNVDRAAGVVSSEPDRNTHLIARPQDPDYGVVGMVASPTNQLAEGTNIHVRLLQSLSTTRSQSGEPFRAQVANDVYKEGRVVIPSGSELRGRIVGVTQGHRLGAHATLRLRPDSVILPDGTAYHLYAQAVSSSQSGTKTDEEGGIRSKTHVTKDLAEYGTGAGSGAIVGGVFGGPIGAGAGALVGAGVVTTHLLLQKPEQARVEQGSEVVFSLTEPMDLLPTRN